MLDTLTTEIVSLDLSDEGNDTAYEQGLDRIMQTSEGIFLYAMTYLFDFKYLTDDVTEEQLSTNQTISLWEDTMTSYCGKIETQLSRAYLKMEQEDFKHVSSWTRQRVSVETTSVRNCP